MSDRRRLGILQCGHAPEELLATHVDYGRLFEVLLGPERFDYRRYAVVDGDFPPDIDTADAWLITGSKHGVYEDHDWIAPLEALVRRAHDAGQPIVGICFGHQLIAQALGGRVEQHPGGWSVGRVEYTLDEQFGVRDAPLIAYHQDQVVDLPPGARSLGTSPFCRHAAMLIGERTLGLQPHPEFDDDYMRGLLSYRGGSLPDGLRDHALASLGGPLARDTVGRSIAAFLST